MRRPRRKGDDDGGSMNGGDEGGAEEDARDAAQDAAEDAAEDREEGEIAADASADAAGEELETPEDAAYGQQSLVLPKNRRSSKIKDHVCETCGKAFRHANELRLHAEVIHNGVRFSCKTCGKSFTRKFHLDTHVRTTHEGQRFACEICKRVFTRKSDVVRHVRSMHDPVTFQCPFDDCTMDFHNRRILRAHVDKKHNGRKYSCPDCDKRFAYKGTLTDHMKWAHKGTYTCQHCSEKFPLRGVLDSHIKTTHPQIRYQCAICPKSFPSDELLQNHVQAIHFRKIDCAVCHLIFADETALVQHMNNEHRGVDPGTQDPTQEQDHEHDVATTIMAPEDASGHALSADAVDGLPKEFVQ